MTPPGGGHTPSPGRHAESIFISGKNGSTLVLARVARETKMRAFHASTRIALSGCSSIFSGLSGAPVLARQHLVRTLDSSRVQGYSARLPTSGEGPW